MFTNEWEVQAKLKGEFYIENFTHSVAVETAPGLTRLSIAPDFNDDKAWSGTHSVTASIAIEDLATGDAYASLVFERSKEIIDHIVGRLIVATGRPIDIVDGIFTRQTDNENPKRHRAIVAVSGVHLAPPTAIAAQMLTAPARPSLEAAIHWWSKAILIPDAADRLHSLFVALELLAKSVPMERSKEVRCRHCGVVDKIMPGLRERLVHLLVNEGGLDHETAEAIYGSRSILVHGDAPIDQAAKRQLRQTALQLQKVSRNIISGRLSVVVPPLPKVLPFDLDSSHALIEYTSP